jgi:hemerythrin superfamily protein
MATAASRSRRSTSARTTRRNGRSATRRSAASARNQRPDALKMLKQDHQRVREMFDRFERTSGSAKERLARTICEELTLHAQLEEDVFYPAVREAIEDEEMMNEAEIEHGTAKDLIGKIESSSAEDERFDALVKVLGEYIRHHVREEEGEMFKQVRRSKLDVEALGEVMQQRKRSLKGEVRPERDVARSARHASA